MKKKNEVSSEGFEYLETLPEETWLERASVFLLVSAGVALLFVLFFQVFVVK